MAKVSTVDSFVFSVKIQLGVDRPSQRRRSTPSIEPIAEQVD